MRDGWGPVAEWWCSVGWGPAVVASPAPELAGSGQWRSSACSPRRQSRRPARGSVRESEPSEQSERDVVKKRKKNEGEKILLLKEGQKGLFPWPKQC